MKKRRNWPEVTVLVNRAMPLVPSTSWLVSFGQAAGGALRELVARTSIFARRLELIGVPSAVLTANCSWVLFRNRGANNFSGGWTGTETSKLIASRVLRA